MKRYPVKKNKDKKVFSNTARKSKKINLVPQFTRGGIKL